jgi:uncharacterized protein (TIGR02996 family)
MAKRKAAKKPAAAAPAKKKATKSEPAPKPAKAAAKADSKAEKAEKPAKAEKPKAEKPAKEKPSAAKAETVSPAPEPKPVRRPRVDAALGAWFDAQFNDPHDLTLLKAFMANPADRDARLLYAEWLEERGHPRGEFLRLVLQAEEAATDMLNARIAQLRSTLGPVWLSAIGDTLARAQPLVTKVDQATGDLAGSLKIESHLGLLDVEYEGDLGAEGSPSHDLVRWLASREVAPVLRSVRLAPRRKPKETGDLDLHLMADAHVEYTNLAQFELTGVRVTDGKGAEHGVLAKLLRKAPKLLELTVPSAPNSEFCTGPAHGTLGSLTVQAGPDSQQFIAHLSRSFRFPKLRRFEYYDVGPADTGDWKTKGTTVEQFEALLKSPAMGLVEHITIHAPLVSDGDAKRLRGLRKGVKFAES